MRPRSGKGARNACAALPMPRPTRLKEPCVSCPFRQGNDAAFAAVIDRLCDGAGRLRPALPAEYAAARRSVVGEAKRTGRLCCHCSVYDASGKPDLRNTTECAGLVAWMTARRETAKRRAKAGAHDA